MPLPWEEKLSHPFSSQYLGFQCKCIPKLCLGIDFSNNTTGTQPFLDPGASQKLTEAPLLLAQI